MMQDYSQSFLDLVGRETALDQEIKSRIRSQGRAVAFKKGALLLHAGEVCRDIYFIVGGKAVSYFTDEHGKTTTWFFHYSLPTATAKNLFAVDYRSFLSETPSKMSIQALSELTAIKFSKNAVDALTANSDGFAFWMRKLQERSLIVAYDRIANLLTRSATERYENFLKEEAYLLDMFSNYHIATYLHVTPQSLSRIRRRLNAST